MHGIGIVSEWSQPGRDWGSEASEKGAEDKGALCWSEPDAGGGLTAERVENDPDEKWSAEAHARPE